MTTTTKIDPREKRAELLSLWERMFKLCEAQVSKMEDGTLDLSASMLKELNAFMKQSAVTLVELEKAQEADEAKALIEAVDNPAEELSEAAQETLEDDGALPFPSRPGVGGEAVEAAVVEAVDPMAVPLEF